MRDSWTQAPNLVEDYYEHRGRALSVKWRPALELPIYERLHSLKRQINELRRGIAQADEYISQHSQGDVTEDDVSKAQEWRRIRERYRGRLAEAETNFWTENIPDDEEARQKALLADRVFYAQSKAREHLDRLSRIQGAEKPVPPWFRDGNGKLTQGSSASAVTPKPQKSSPPVAASGPVSRKPTTETKEISIGQVPKEPTNEKPQERVKVSQGIALKIVGKSVKKTGES